MKVPGHERRNPASRSWGARGCLSQEIPHAQPSGRPESDADIYWISSFAIDNYPRGERVAKRPGALVVADGSCA
ncbi:hypothetical protein NDU88_000987 [Pleurodeles waltl]|uniref:Uncharacterized protein n=1 Tax=Pleurodeles waltl TaxID=8319 RepID=A0AAV7N9R1_PLEWA|nr:hypothetical protein NDU88_000987 [Pleurodeles waltl]